MMPPGPKISTPAGDAPVIPVALVMIGGYLAWFGIHYWRRDVTWPTDPVKAVLQGKPVPAPGSAPAATTAILTADIGALQPDAGGSGGGGSGGQSGGTQTHTQLEALWTANGGSAATANVAAAIAQAESSGDAKATSPNPDGGTNVGLWQLDTKGKGAGFTVAQLQDPNTNAHVAIMGSANGTDWSAWATWATGAYRKFLA